LKNKLQEKENLYLDDSEGDEFSFVDEHRSNEKQIKCRKIPTLTHLKLCNKN